METRSSVCPTSERHTEEEREEKRREGGSYLSQFSYQQIVQGHALTITSSTPRGFDIQYSEPDPPTTHGVCATALPPWPE